VPRATCKIHHPFGSKQNWSKARQGGKQKRARQHAPKSTDGRLGVAFKLVELPQRLWRWFRNLGRHQSQTSTTAGAPPLLKPIKQAKTNNTAHAPCAATLWFW
jgi:hypothetical protein